MKTFQAIFTRPMVEKKKKEEKKIDIVWPVNESSLSSFLFFFFLFYSALLSLETERDYKLHERAR